VDVPVYLSDKMKFLKSVARNWGNIVFAYSSQCKAILEYALFDAAYYCKQESGPRGSELKHLRHYLVSGFLHGRDPHPLFSTSYYLDNNPDLVKSGMNPLTHYVLHGYKEGRNPHPLFDASYYYSKINCPAEDVGNPLIHYLQSSITDKKSPHPLFSILYYLDNNPDLAKSGTDPLIHYVKCGYKEGRNPHPLFDTSYYLKKQTVPTAVESNPLIHYLLSDKKDKRSPHPLFSISYYLDNNPDLAKAGIDPFIHYLKHGYKEKRNPHQLFNTLFYCHKYMNCIGEIENPLEHFFLYGLAEKTDPHPLFNTSYYLQQNPGAIESGLNPLVHFLENGYKKKNDIYLYRKHKRRIIKTILIIEPGSLKFDYDSGSLRLYHIIMMLVELGYNVILWTPYGPSDMRYSKVFEKHNVKLPFQENGLLNYLKEKGSSLDMVILCRRTGANQFLDTVMALTDAKIVFDTVDLHYLRDERKARLLNEPIDPTIKLQELHIARCADEVVVVSPIEKRMLANEGLEDKVSIITNIHTLRPPCRSFADRTGLMFIGGFGHLPNVDGMIWFVQEIFPKIKQQIPEMHLDIVGSHPPPSIQSLSSEDITVTGYIEDVAPHFEKARVFVSPLRYGAGVKGKIGQSLAHRLPVVTTSIGAEGMHLEDGVSAMIADDESSFSQKVIELYQDQGLWEVLSQNACEIIEQYFSPEIVKKALLEMIESDRESCERN
jgi:O-antigen biosynthesis protein